MSRSFVFSLACGVGWRIKTTNSVRAAITSAAENVSRAASECLGSSALPPGFFPSAFFLPKRFSFGFLMTIVMSDLVSWGGRLPGC